MTTNTTTIHTIRASAHDALSSSASFPSKPAASSLPSAHRSSSVPPVTEEDIAEFLLQTPEFFERYAEVLGSVQLHSPHGNRAVSLQERQAEMLREKIKALEQRTMEMVRQTKDNSAIAHKVHQWSCTLQRNTEAGTLPEALLQSLSETFEVPQASLRVWDVATIYQEIPHAQGASSDVRAFASSLTAPFCGPNRGFEASGWLSDSASVQSLALLPLRDGAIDSATPAFGLLVLASPDAARFVDSMGTEFLVQMAEVASAALSRLR